MENLKDKSCLVIDNGLFVHVAQKMTEYFDRVFYWTPWVNAFPKSNATLPGSGLEGITRILHWEQYIDQSDLTMVPDVMFGPLQVQLVKQGKRVFGARMGEDLEMKRWEFKKLLKRLNMPVAESHLIVGIAALRRFIQQRKGKWWIKTSRYRGDFETFDVEGGEDGYALAMPKLDELEYKLGRKKLIYPFVIESDIPAIIEVGYDGWTVNGGFADIALMGKEEKDLGLVGVVKKYTELPAAVQWCNQMMSDELRKYGYCGFWSTEVRCAREEDFDNPEPVQFEEFEVIWNKGVMVPDTDMYAFLTDPCCRAASPPSELYIEWFDNWGEIAWAAAEGRIVQPIPNGTWGVEVMLHSAWADSNWQAVKFPSENARWIKLRNMAKIDGEICTVPQNYGLPEIGAAIAIDNDLMTAIRSCKERADSVQGYFVEAKTDAIPKAIAAIKKAQENGIHFSDDPMPDAQELSELVEA